MKSIIIKEISICACYFEVDAELLRLTPKFQVKIEIHPNAARVSKLKKNVEKH